MKNKMSFQCETSVVISLVQKMIIKFFFRNGRGRTNVVFFVFRERLIFGARGPFFCFLSFWRALTGVCHHCKGPF